MLTNAYFPARIFHNTEWRPASTGRPLSGFVCYTAAMIEWVLVFTLSGTPLGIDDTVRGFSSRAECAVAAREFVKAYPRFQFFPDDREFLFDYAVVKPVVRCVEDRGNPFSTGK